MPNYEDSKNVLSLVIKEVILEASFIHHLANYTVLGP